MNLSSQPSVVQAVTIATVDQLRDRIRSKSKLKGRQADEASLAEVRALIGPRPAEGFRRDLLIEHLHLLNDTYRCLHARHLVALAKEMNIPMAEVYEVATFYHHFEVVKDGEAAPGLTVRVCDGLACELAGAQDLLARLPALLGTQDVRVVAAPCIGRCEQAPAVVVHQYPVAFATVKTVVAALNTGYAQYPPAQAATLFIAHGYSEKSVSPLPPQHETAPAYAGYDVYRASGGYALAASDLAGEEGVERLITAMEDSGLRGLGGAGFPAGRKWRIVR
ncbi:MAG: NAD(P)H-dependent oxidoreductase subunit E, partial [Polaromonas sp.]